MNHFCSSKPLTLHTSLALVSNSMSYTSRSLLQVLSPVVPSLRIGSGSLALASISHHVLDPKWVPPVVPPAAVPVVAVPAAAPVISAVPVALSGVAAPVPVVVLVPSTPAAPAVPVPAASLELHRSIPAAASSHRLGSLEALVRLELAGVLELGYLSVRIAIHSLDVLLWPINASPALAPVKQRFRISGVLVLGTEPGIHARGLVEETAVEHALRGQLAGSFQHS
mmetsp:Transcript_15917/g.21928  ORF Transcript_15917/g.21928 Transcript_15917/m.21928 type:complete len:225 (-) Transcript_15917:1359-2033(-)